MKKLILITILCLGFCLSGSSHIITLIGAYQSTGPGSFRCALVSANFCAKIRVPDEPEKGPYGLTVYNPNGTILNEFEITKFTITEGLNETLINYELP